MLEWLEAMGLLIALMIGVPLLIGGVMDDSLAMAGGGLLITGAAVGRILNKAG